jgi:hypothetical protein
MSKRMSPKQIEANRRNAQKSTGPKTPDGQAVSKMNALKHGILSEEVVVHGRWIDESDTEFAALHERLWEDLKPIGMLEEMLVDKIVSNNWRLRRVLKAESGEIVLSVDNGYWKRIGRNPMLTTMEWDVFGDPVHSMKNSTMGNNFLESELKEVRASVEQEGELTEAAIKSVIYHRKPYSLTKELEELRSQLQQNPEGLEPSALRAKQKERALAYLDEKLRQISQNKSDCLDREVMEEQARQAAAVLPEPEVLDKIMRYETMLNRQLDRDINQLERLQRIRRGEAVPPPLTMEVSNGH